MPLPLLPLAIGAGSLVNTASQWLTNQGQKNFSREMYARQRKDALADWEMQNVYNSPAEQMRRLKEAGLNPNLVYGNGAQSSQVSPMRSASVEGYSPQPPQFNTGSLMAMYDTQVKQAQIDNLKTQNTVGQQEAILKAATTKNVETNTALSNFSLGKNKSLLGTDLAMAQGNLDKLMQDINISSSRNEREALLNATTVREGLARIANLNAENKAIMARTAGYKLDNVVKGLEAEFAKLNIRPGDPIWMRGLMEAWNSLKGHLQKGMGILNPFRK